MKEAKMARRKSIKNIEKKIVYILILFIFSSIRLLDYMCVQPQQLQRFPFIFSFFCFIGQAQDLPLQSFLRCYCIFNLFLCQYIIPFKFRYFYEKIVIF